MLVVLTLVHYFAAKQASMRWAQSQVREVMRLDEVITFSVPGNGFGPKKAVLRATDAVAAAAIKARVAEMPMEAPSPLHASLIVQIAAPTAAPVEHTGRSEPVLSPSSADPASTAVQGVGERLKTLDQLRQQGLVSPEAHEAKRRQILGDI